MGGMLVRAQGSQRRGSGASPHTHAHTQAPRPLTQESCSQASLKYCGFSMMCPWSPEPLPSVGDKELPPKVIKCRDMASPSSGASAAAPGEVTQPDGGGHTPGTQRWPLLGYRAPGNPSPDPARVGQGREGASRGRGGTLSVWLPSNPRPCGATKELPHQPRRAQTSQTHLVFDYDPAAD